MKNITRTITSYKHTFVKMNDDMDISDMKEVICAEKMGPRTSDDLPKHEIGRSHV